MKKTKLLRLLFMVTVAVTILAASAVVASAKSAEDPITDDAAYKYSKVYNDVIKISFTQNLFENPMAEGYVYCRVEVLDREDYWLSLRSPEFILPNGWKNTGEKWVDKEGTSKHIRYGVMTLTDANSYLFQAGTYNLKVQYGGRGIGTETIDFYFTTSLKKPTGMKITTYPDKIYFNTENIWPSLSGDTTIVEANGKAVELKNRQNGDILVKGFDFESGKKYDLKMYGTTVFGEQKLYGPAYTAKNVILGPKTTPVIKSVKISNVKVSKYFDYKEWKYRYKTKYKITVNLSKKAANIKGIYLTAAGTNGFTGEYKKVKGTGKTFTTTITKDAPKSQKGKKIKVSVRTYSDNKYKAYSNQSKSKTVTIR